MSLNTTPTVLTSIDSSAIWHGAMEYRLRSETSTEAVYDALNLNNGNWNSNPGSDDIKVTFATNVWEDSGGGNPHDVDDSGSTDVVLSSSGTLFYKFIRPTTASWLQDESDTESTTGGTQKKVFCNFW